MIDNRKEPFQNRSNGWLFGIFVVSVVAFSGFKYYTAKPSLVDRSHDRTAASIQESAASVVATVLQRSIKGNETRTMPGSGTDRVAPLVSASRSSYSNRSVPQSDARQQPSMPLDRQQELLVAATSAVEESNRSNAIAELGASDSSEVEQALTQILLGGDASQPRISAIDAMYAIALRNPERIDSVFSSIASATGDPDPYVAMQARMIYEQLRMQRPAY